MLVVWFGLFVRLINVCLPLYGYYKVVGFVILRFVVYVCVVVVVCCLLWGGGCLVCCLSW